MQYNAMHARRRLIADEIADLNTTKIGWEAVRLERALNEELQEIEERRRQEEIEMMEMDEEDWIVKINV